MTGALIVWTRNVLNISVGVAILGCASAAARAQVPALIVPVAGWSEGGGLSVLAAAAGDEKKALAGLVTLGLRDENVISWHWSDNLESFVRKPHEQTFHAADDMASVAPLPLAMIESSNDQYVGVAESQRLFAAASDPKRFDLVPAENHRFDGNHKEFFLKLQEELRWVGQPH